MPALLRQSVWPDRRSITAIAVGTPATVQGVVATKASESSLLKARTTIDGSSVATTDQSETRQMIVFGGVSPSRLEFSAMNAESRLAPTRATSSGFGYVWWARTLPSEIRTTHMSVIDVIWLAMTAW